MQKSGKLSLLLVLALSLSLGLAASVWAQPKGPKGKGMGHGPGMMNLTPEQAGKIFDLKEKLHADTAGLRKQMMIKHAELAALWKAETPDQNAILAKQKELNALRDQMQEKMTAFQFEAMKIVPNFRLGMGPGGMGMMGPGGGPPLSGPLRDISTLIGPWLISLNTPITKAGVKMAVSYISSFKTSGMYFSAIFSPAALRIMKAKLGIFPPPFTRGWMRNPNSAFLISAPAR